LPVCPYLIASSSCVLCTQCCQFVRTWLPHRPVSCVPNVASLSILDCLIVLCLVYPMLPVCPYLIASSSCVLCTQCCQFVRTWLPHRPVSCVPNVASLSVLDCPIVLCLVYPMLPVFPYLIAPSSCVLCTQCCQFFRTWLPLRFSLAFIMPSRTLFDHVSRYYLGMNCDWSSLRFVLALTS
jgi:hypothetical protein